MFRPVNQKIYILIGLALINTIFFYWVSNSRVPHLQPGYNYKMKAGKLFEKSVEVIKEYQIKRENFTIDLEDDPFGSGLIGPATTLITTSLASLRNKQTTLNPNIPALFVELLMNAGIKSGDTIAISLTGSYPSLNIALYAACEVMDISPIVISSLGSSKWGATDSEFTWIDMESLLFSSKLLKNKSIAVSYGGRGDRGKDLKSEGRDLLWEAIYRNNIKFVYAKRLIESIEKKINIYNSILPIKDYKAYINIGGGASSIGQSVNSRLIPNGFSLSKDIGELIGPSIIQEFINENVSIIHINDIVELFIRHNLVVYPNNFNKLGIGKIYYEMRYNLLYSLIALTITLGLLIALSIITYKQVKMRMSIYDSESLL